MDIINRFSARSCMKTKTVINIFIARNVRVVNFNTKTGTNSNVTVAESCTLLLCTHNFHSITPVISSY